VDVRPARKTREDAADDLNHRAKVRVAGSSPAAPTVRAAGVSRSVFYDHDCTSGAFRMPSRHTSAASARSFSGLKKGAGKGPRSTKNL
jgi:hypothetical protein